MVTFHRILKVTHLFAFRTNLITFCEHVFGRQNRYRNVSLESAMRCQWSAAKTVHRTAGKPSSTCTFPCQNKFFTIHRETTNLCSLIFRKMQIQNSISKSNNNRRYCGRSFSVSWFEGRNSAEDKDTHKPTSDCSNKCKNSSRTRCQSAAKKLQMLNIAENPPNAKTRPGFMQKTTGSVCSQN